MKTEIEFIELIKVVNSHHIVLYEILIELPSLEPIARKAISKAIDADSMLLELMNQRIDILKTEKKPVEPIGFSNN